MSDIRCLTVRQPMASALLAGVKPVENRSYTPPGWRGEPRWIGLHAGAAEWPMTDTVLSAVWPDHPPLADMPRGAILGLMRIDQVCQLHDLPAVLARSPWATGPWCWVVGRTVALPKPIPHRGQLGLWKPKPAAHRALEKLLEGTNQQKLLEGTNHA